MVGATTRGVTVCCPECGGVLRVSLADGGSIIGCHRCGESVRVPARPHPVETPAEAPSPLPYHLARPAAEGVRLLQASLGLFALEHVILAVTFAVWVGLVGPAGVAARVVGPAAGWLALIAGLDLGLCTARAVIRWNGYRRVESAAAALGVEGWVRSARWATVLRLVGYAGTFAPWVGGVPFVQVPVWGQVLSAMATVAWFAGGVLEFGVLVAWHRLLGVVGTRIDAGRPTWYAAGVAAGLVVLTVGLSLVQLTAITAARRLDPLHRPRVGLADLPADALPAAFGLLLVGGGVVAVLVIQYGKLLTAMRERLREA